MVTQPGLAVPVDKPKEEKPNLPEVQDHLWIAGQREQIENFEPSDVLFVGDSSKCTRLHELFVLLVIRCFFT